MINPDYLAKKNAHPRDKLVTFEEVGHKYTVDGDDDYMSVTTWNHKHFEEFNPDAAIKMMKKGRKWNETHPFYGKTNEEIKEIWKSNGIESSKAGTKMHFDIECFYNNINPKNESIEFKYFLNFNGKIKNMEAYRTEMIVWDKTLKLCGSIDMLYEHEDGRVSIYDWKRCKEIKMEGFRGKSSKTEAISHLPDSNFWHYSLQLNTYKYLLEKNYNKVIKGMYLICLHPNNKNKNYLKYKVPVLKDEIKDLMKMRLEMVKKENMLKTCDWCYKSKDVKVFNKDEYGEKSLCKKCLIETV